MDTRFRRLLAALLALAVLTPELQADGWKVGIATEVITPEQPLWLAGYALRDRPAEGKIHDLWVKALVLEDSAGTRAVIVTSDLLGFPRAISEDVCAGIVRQCKIERSRILLSSTHTHSGPVLSDALSPCYPLDKEQRQRIDAYSKKLQRQLVATVKKATERLVPASLSAGTGEATFAVNRRNNREPDVPRLRAEGVRLEGPVDHSVPVLIVRSKEEKLLAVVFGYACHNTNLDGYKWCGDYAGFAQLAMEEKFPGTTAMFWSGCGADQNPLPRRSLELCEKYGRRLAASVVKVVEGSPRTLAPRLRAGFDLIQLEFQGLPSKKKLETMTQSGPIYRRRWARMVLDELQSGTPPTASYPYPVQVWRFGEEQLWIILGGEVVVDYALRFKREFGAGTWVTAYSNDVMAYIPSRRIQLEGGYEAAAMDVYGLPSTGWAPDVEERVAAAVHRLATTLAPTQGSPPCRVLPPDPGLGMGGRGDGGRSGRARRARRGENRGGEGAQERLRGGPKGLQEA